MLVFACIKKIESVKMVSWDSGLAEAGLNDGTFDKIVPVETDLSYDEIGELFNEEKGIVTLEDLESSL